MEQEAVVGIDRYTEIKRKLHEYAFQDDDIRAVIAIGSSARKAMLADEYSDLDLLIITKKPERWFSGEYPELLGKVRISFIEPTLGGGMERRSIYDEDKDVDMIILTPDQFGKALKDGVAGWVMNRGYRILHDPDGYAELISQQVKAVVSCPEITEEEFVNLVNDFYFHNIWACKKLLRGELWSAKMCIDAYLKNHLLKMIEQYQAASSGADVWHDGRFLDRWAAPDVREQLKDCFAHYDIADCRDALKATHVLFSRLAVFVADRKGFVYPSGAEECAADYIGRYCGGWKETSYDPKKIGEMLDYYEKKGCEVRTLSEYQEILAADV